MEVGCMRANMRKFAIWYTPNFKPIISHDELDRIMSTLGFIPQPLSTTTPTTTTTTTTTAVVWKEYSFSGAGAFILKSHSPPPRPRLPYPRIDGLHVNTYRDFLESLNFYLRMNNISDLFHIRGIPLHHAHDRNQKWLRMVDDDLVYVYREGTNDLSEKNSNVVHNKDQKTVLRIVPLKNIITRIL